MNLNIPMMKLLITKNTSVMSQMIPLVQFKLFTQMEKLLVNLKLKKKKVEKKKRKP